MDATVGDAKVDAASYRWVILAVCWTAFIFDTICRLAWTSVATTAADSIGLPVVAFGTVVTAFLIGSVICNILGGLGSDRLGGRIIVTLSMVFLGISTFAFSFMSSIPMELAIQLLMGLSAGATYAGCIKLIVTWFDQSKRGQAMGLFLTSISLGIVVTNAVVSALMTAIGWQGVYRLLGAATSVLGLICYAVLRNRQVAAPRQTVNALPTPGLRELLTNRNLLLAAAAGFGGFWGTWGFTYWANALFVKGRGFSPVEAGAVVALVGSIGLFGKPLAGWISDRLGGRHKPLVIGVLLMFSVVLAVFGMLTSRTAFYAVAPLLGIGAFCYTPLVVTLMANLSGPRMAGSVAGMATALWQVGGLIVPLVVGYVFQATASFIAVFIVLALGPLLGAICMMLLKVEPVEKPKTITAPPTVV